MNSTYGKSQRGTGRGNGACSTPLCRWVWLARSSVAVLVVATVISSAFAELPTPTKVEWSAGRLSVTAAKVPLSQVIHEVARQCGLHVRGSQELKEQVSVHFSRLPLEEGLRSLLAGVDYALLGDASTPEKARQAQLVIFGHRPTGATSTSSPPKPVGTIVVPNTPPKEASTEDVQTLAKKVLSPDPTVQSQAFENLAAKNPQKAVEALQNALKTDQPSVRLQALQLLDEFDQADPQVVFDSLRSALGDQDPRFKDYAIQALARRGGQDAIGLLRQAFADPDPSIRLAVLESVAQSGEGSDLIQQALSDPDQSVSSAAAQIMKANNPPSLQDEEQEQQLQEQQDQPNP